SHGQGTASEQEQEQTKTQKYTCPMHPEVITASPGNCPKCGMKLVPVEEKKRRTPNAQRPTPKSERGVHIEHQTSNIEHSMEILRYINLADPMRSEASATSWIPDSSPMYGRMFMFGENMLMLHGAIFPRYTNVSTRRGDDRIDAPNWFMGMFSRPL